jgi:UDP-glucose 4-epimerase
LLKVKEKAGCNLDFFLNKKILITGGDGYLAGGLVTLLQDTDCSILRLSRRGAARVVLECSANIMAIPGDIREPDLWAGLIDGVEVVFHLAAQTSTYIANADPLVDHEVNVLPMLRLLEACRQSSSSPTICFASTVTVAGIAESLPVDEEHPDHPLTVYDLHKQMAEQYLRWYAQQGLVRGVTLRLANIYGPGPRSSRNDRGILNQMIGRALSGEPLTVYGSGDQVRDYLYIEDAARAFLSAVAHGEALSGQTFVIGSGVGHSIVSALEMVAARATARIGKPVEVVHMTPPETLSPIEQRDFVANSSQFHKATGWLPQYSLGEGIDRTMEALL